MPPSALLDVSDEPSRSMQDLQAGSERICSSVASLGTPSIVPLGHLKCPPSGSWRMRAASPVGVPSIREGGTRYRMSGNTTSCRTLASVVPYGPPERPASGPSLAHRSTAQDGPGSFGTVDSHCKGGADLAHSRVCLLYTSPSPRDGL